MLANPLAQTTAQTVARHHPSPCIGIFPFHAYICEFLPNEVEQNEWSIRHRDSREHAYISAGYRDSHSMQIVWRVTTTLCSGTAEFSSHRSAERFVATMLRCSAGRAPLGGEPRSGFSLGEVWWFFKRAIFGRCRNDSILPDGGNIFERRIFGCLTSHR